MAIDEILNREALIQTLIEVAELEHEITCQYLFAAFSLKDHVEEGRLTWPQLERVRAWKADILLIARQEMEHHGLVCNLLTAIGGASHFRRFSFPHKIAYCPPFPTFELQRFDAATLKRFICFEKLHDPQAKETGTDETIGTLYQKIRVGLERVGKENSRLFIGPVETQVTNHDLSIAKKQFDIDLVPVSDLSSALQVIDQIIGAGEALSDPHPHYTKFVNILCELERLQGEDADFEPARPVAPNPLVSVPGSPPKTSVGITMVEHPQTRQGAVLFNRVYETMLLILTRFYGPTGETPEEMEGLRRIAFFPMMTAVIRPLGEILTHMPVCEDAGSKTAGSGFECTPDLTLSTDKRSAWAFLHERFQDHAASCAQFGDEVGQVHMPWAEHIHPRIVFLQENLEQITTNFERYMHMESLYVEHLMKRVL